MAANKSTSLPSWITRKEHQRTGLKLIALSPEDYGEMLGLLTAEERHKFEAIAEALGQATQDEQEAFKLTLAEILGYVTLIKYCGVDKVRQLVKGKITANPKYAELLERI